VTGEEKCAIERVNLEGPHTGFYLVRFGPKRKGLGNEASPQSCISSQKKTKHYRVKWGKEVSLFPRRFQSQPPKRRQGKKKEQKKGQKACLPEYTGVARITHYSRGTKRVWAAKNNEAVNE